MFSCCKLWSTQRRGKSDDFAVSKFSARQNYIRGFTNALLSASTQLPSVYVKVGHDQFPEQPFAVTLSLFLFLFLTVHSSLHAPSPLGLLSLTSSRVLAPNG
jgi:hypothetical protein